MTEEERKLVKNLMVDLINSLSIQGRPHRRILFKMLRTFCVLTHTEFEAIMQLAPKLKEQLEWLTDEQGVQ